MSAAALTGWCSPAFGMTHTAAEHRACETHRPVCGCEDFGGHQKVAESLTQQGVSGSESGTIRGQLNGPERGVGTSGRGLIDATEERQL